MADMSETKITGGCLCGAVRYELDPVPGSNTCCHCRMCQKATGAPVVGITLLPIDAIRYTSGQPKAYKSSDIAERGFCAECGTSLYYRAFLAELIGILTATLDNPNHYPFDGHYGVEGQLNWISFDDDSPRYEYVDDYIGRRQVESDWLQLVRQVKQ